MLRSQDLTSQYVSFIDHCHIYHETYVRYLSSGPSPCPVSPTRAHTTDVTNYVPTTTPRYHHNWYDTDHGSAILDWCHRKHIDTHPQRRKPRSPASFTSLRKARNFSKRLQHHLFQTRLRHTAGHQLTVTHPNPYLRTQVKAHCSLGSHTSAPHSPIRSVQCPSTQTSTEVRLYPSLGGPSPTHPTFPAAPVPTQPQT